MSELKDYDIMDIEAMDDERLEKSESGKIQATRVYLKSEADTVIAEKDKEIADLKAKLESAQASMYADVVDAGMENRRLKRTLWMHRAITAKLNKEGCKAMREYNPFIGIEEYKWQEVERKCQAKAEEYR